MELTKEKKQMIAVGSLGVVLIFLLFGGGIKKGSRMHGGGGAASGSQVTQIITEFDTNFKLVANKEINDTLEQIMEEKVQEGWERNPFEILVSTIPGQSMIGGAQVAGEDLSKPSFHISGIVFDGDPNLSSVIVDGEFYAVGDTIDGWTIVSIESESVYFTSGEVEYIFSLYEQQ